MGIDPQQLVGVRIDSPECAGLRIAGQISDIGKAGRTNRSQSAARLIERKQGSCSRKIHAEKLRRYSVACYANQYHHNREAPFHRVSLSGSDCWVVNLALLLSSMIQHTGVRRITGKSYGHDLIEWVRCTAVSIALKRHPPSRDARRRHLPNGPTRENRFLAAAVARCGDLLASVDASSRPPLVRSLREEPTMNANEAKAVVRMQSY